MATFLMMILASVASSSDDAQLLCFGATWCEPCRQMQPALEKLTRDGYPIRKIDVDNHGEMARRYSVAAVPSFVLVDGSGKVIDRIDQATRPETLEKMLAHYRVHPVPATVRGQSPGTQSAIGVPDLKAAVSKQQDNPPIATAPAATSRGSATATPFDVKPFPDASPYIGQEENANLGFQRRSLATGSPPDLGIRSSGDVSSHAMSSTIRLKVEDEGGHSFGTGTVIDVHGQEALVLTCGHIFRPSAGKGRILMDRFDSPTAEPTVGSLISYDMDLDIGLVSMKLTRPIQVAQLAPLTYKVEKDESIFSVGCSKGEKPTIMNGKVNQIDRYLGPPNITASGRPVDGRSGGGLFNKAGELIGVCSAADPEIDEGLYAALPRVYYELDRNGLSFVYDPSKKAISEQPIAQVATTSQNLKGMAAPLRTPALIAPSNPGLSNPTQSNAVPTTKQSHTSVANEGAKHSNDELVCVLRGDDKAKSRVFVIENPSDTLIDYLSREAAKGK